jgi:hypothetical protein
MKIIELVRESSWDEFLSKSLGDVTGGGSVGSLIGPSSNSKTSDTSSDTDSSTAGATSARVDKDGSIVIGNQKRSGGTISWRANNPGNVMYGAFAKSHGSIGSAKAADAEPVAIMPTLDHGIKMQMALWRRPMYNNLTIDKGAQQWAVAVKKQGRGSKYARDLAAGAGATIDTRVSDLSDDQLKGLIKAQMRWEGFKPGTVTTV